MLPDPECGFEEVAGCPCNLTAYEKETKDKLKVKCPLDLTFTMDSVLSLCKEATMHKNHLTILIDSVRKM